MGREPNDEGRAERPMITMGQEGLELLLRKASVDRRFRRRLVATRDVAARELGVELDGPTLRSLQGASREWLLEQMATIELGPRERSALLGDNLLAMLEAMQDAAGDGQRSSSAHGTLDSLPAFTPAPRTTSGGAGAASAAAAHSAPTAPEMAAVANSAPGAESPGAGVRRGFVPTYPKPRWASPPDDEQAALSTARPGKARARRAPSPVDGNLRPGALGHRVPVAVEALLGKASLQPEFAQQLLQERSAAADPLGMPLTQAERTLLDGLDRAHLESMLEHVRLADEHTAVLRGQDGLAMLAALGDPRPGQPAALAAAAPPSTAGGLRASVGPDELPRPPRRGVRRILALLIVVTAATVLAGGVAGLAWWLLRGSG